MRHLQPCPLASTLHIEALIRFRTVQNRLVAAHVLRHIVQSLNDPQPEFLALLIFRDGNVFDVPDETEVVDAHRKSARIPTLQCADRGVLVYLQFPFNNQRSRAHNLVLVVENN